MPDKISPRRLRVFLCHSSGDKTAVRDLYRKLRNDGFYAWLDEEDLLPGQQWEREIPLAVRGSDIVIVCLSNASITKTGYIQKELKFALDIAQEQPEGTIFIIPVKLEECEIPEGLSRLHWVNLFQPDGYEKLVKALNHRAETIDDIPSPPDQKSKRRSLVKSSTTDSTDTYPQQLPEVPFVATQQDALPPKAPRVLKFFTGSQGIIVVALITTFVTLITGYWLFYKPSGTNEQVRYTGRVINATTQHPIANAKISIETQGPPQVYYTDTEGVFDLNLSKSIDSARIRAEAEGYELFDRNVAVSRIGIEYVRLSPIPIPTPNPTATPSATPRKQPTNVPCSAENRLLRKC